MKVCALTNSWIDENCKIKCPQHCNFPPISKKVLASWNRVSMVIRLFSRDLNQNLERKTKKKYST